MKCCMGGRGAAASTSTELGLTKIEKVDAVFADAKAALDSVETFRAGLEDAKTIMMGVSGACSLKEGSLSDAVSLFFWSMGADMGLEKLAAYKPKISMEEPYLELPELDAGASDEHKEFYGAFMLWCQTVGNSPKSVEELTTKITDAATKAKELTGTITTDATEAGLSAMDKVKAAKTVASNSVMIGKGAAKMTELGAVATSSVADMKALVEALPGIMTDATKNVTEGNEKEVKTMAEFADKQHSKENLDAAAMKKSADKLAYDALKKAGKTLPGAKKEEAAEEKKEEEAAPAAETAVEAVAVVEEAAAAVEASVAAVEDVQPEVRDV